MPDQPDSLDLLLANICFLHHTRAHQLFEALGLYRGQPPVLRILWDDEGLSQAELAARLKLAPATITRMLQRMEKSGFIQRRPDTSDQRISRVYLTQAGRMVKSQVEVVWATMERECFANLSPQELASLRQGLTQVRQNLLQATGEEPWK